MKKFVSLVLTVLLAVSLAACSGWKSEIKDYSGDVSSNGGFAVVKGDYVYFINGVSDNEADNTFGSVVTGGIVRVKTADLGKADAEAELVVPKAVYTEYYGDGSGLFISGDYVYYPTPCDKKNSKGEVKNDMTEFRRTKLDGTDSSVILTVDSLDTPYRFFEDGKDVYLTVLSTETVSDKEVKYLVTYNVKGKQVAKSRAIEGYSFGAFGGAYAYYTSVVHDDKLDVDESFNALYRYSFNGKEDVEILNGGGIGMRGAKFSLVKVAAKDLYVSITYVENSTVTSTVYYAVAYSELNAAGTEAAVGANVALLNAAHTLNNGSSDAVTIFSGSSVYVAPNCIVYLDGNKGLVKYDYNDRDSLNFGISDIFTDDELKTYSFAFEKDNKMYFNDADGFYYRVDLAGIVNIETGAALNETTATVERLTYAATNVGGNWLAAEFVGDYMLYQKENSPYLGYIFVEDTKAFDKYLAANYETAPTGEDYDKALSDFVEKNDEFTKEGFEARLSKRIGILSEADKNTVDDYMKSFDD